MRESRFGQERPVAIATGAVKAWLHTPEMFFKTHDTIAWLSEPENVVSLSSAMVQHVRDHGVVGTASGLVNGAVDGIRSDFHEMTYGNGERLGEVGVELLLGGGVRLVYHLLSERQARGLLQTALTLSASPVE